MRALKNKTIAAACAALFTISPPLIAEATSDSEQCSSFSTVYYQLNYENVLQASRFFREVTVEQLDDSSGRLSSAIGTVNKKITFFDTEELALLTSSSSISHSENLKLPKYRTQREKIELAAPDTNVTPYEAKNYNRRIAPEDKHPLIGRVKRKDRPLLYQQLADMGVQNPIALKKQLTVNHEVVTRQFRLYGTPVAEFSINNYEIQNFGIPTRATTLSIERIEKANNTLTPTESTELDQLLCAIDQMARDNISGLEPQSAFGYKDLYRRAATKLPSYQYFKEHPAQFHLGQAVILIAIGFLILTLIIGRHPNKRTYRQTHTVRSST